MLANKRSKTSRKLFHMNVLETERLCLREIRKDDAEFILELLNEPSFHKYIGDKGVRDISSAEAYIDSNFQKSYRENGYGLWLVATKNDDTKLGICGLVNRDTLDHPDIGFAFLAKYERNGYGYESALAVLEHGRINLRIPTIVAITTTDNVASGRLLEKIGLSFEEFIETPNGEELRLYSITF